MGSPDYRLSRREVAFWFASTLLIKSAHKQRLIGEQSTMPEQEQKPAIGLLLNLEAAWWGRSVLLSNEQKLLLKEGKRGLHRTPKWIFMSSSLNLIWCDLAWPSLNLPWTFHGRLLCPILDLYVGMQSCISWWCGGSATSYPNEVLGSTTQTWLNGLALSHVLHLTLSGTPKILLYCTEYNRPTTLAPTNEESWAQRGKTL